MYTTIEPATLKVLDNVGGHALPEGRSGEVEGRPQSLWVGALDGDASPDAVVASLDGLTVFTRGLGHSQHIEVGEALVEVQAGDLDGDGRAEIVAADRDAGALWVVRSQEAGFAAPQPIATGPAPEYLELYDLDGDGSLDALTHGKLRTGEVHEDRVMHAATYHAGGGAGGSPIGGGATCQLTKPMATAAT